MSDEFRGGDGKQWKMALQIRTQLREYYSAIKQHEEVASIRRPSEHQRKTVCTYIQSESLGGNCQFLGRDLGDDLRLPSVFNGSNREDLVFIGDDTGKEDLISRSIKGPVLRFGHRLWSLLSDFFSSMTTARTRHGAQNIEERGNGAYLDYCPDTKLRLVLDLFGSAISCIIPCISIIVLFFVKDILRRIYIVCTFSFVFSVFMSLATRARRIEIFGATCAFASVQVVFVGTTNDS
ncbi:hypothetical protein V8F33_004042 [Rhypophila sp. PSN 637]